jgi:hypothetical protein
LYRASIRSSVSFSRSGVRGAKFPQLRYRGQVVARLYVGGQPVLGRRQLKLGHRGPLGFRPRSGNPGQRDSLPQVQRLEDVDVE